MRCVRMSRKRFLLSNKVTTENVAELADIEGYWEDFYKMFGFHIDGVDYEADVEV